MLVHAEWDAAAAQALVDHPSCCVMLDVDPVAHDDAMHLLEYVRLSAPEAPIVVLSARDDDELALAAVKAGAQDCLVTSEVQPGSLRRALVHAIERKRSEAELARQALYDQLTGLPNRVLFLDRLGVALDRARRSHTQLAVMFLDFDNFKEINDTRGHAVGDRLLTTLGQRLSTLLRPMDTVARFGGDEFTFLFEDLTSEREVVLIADRICQAASLPIETDGIELTVTVSVGIAMVADPTVAAETIIREADAAMYRAKERGRSRFELFDEESRLRGIARIELEAAIRQAVDRGQLRLHYQRRIALGEFRHVPWVDAQVHWQHPRRGLLGPAEFMPLAEETGMAVPIGQFALEHAVAQLASWRASRPGTRLSLGISSRQARDANLASVVREVIRAHRDRTVRDFHRDPRVRGQRGSRCGDRHVRSAQGDRREHRARRLRARWVVAVAPDEAADRRAQDPRELHPRARRLRRGGVDRARADRARTRARAWGRRRRRPRPRRNSSSSASSGATPPKGI